MTHNRYTIDVKQQENDEDIWHWEISENGKQLFKGISGDELDAIFSAGAAVQRLSMLKSHIRTRPKNHKAAIGIERMNPTQPWP